MLNMDYHYGGTLETIKNLIDNQIPVIWLHHVPTGKVWIPHAALVIGYDDTLRKMVVTDPAFGSEVILSYKEFLSRWYRTNNLVVTVTSKIIALKGNELNRTLGNPVDVQYQFL